ncbi:hypothetical protein M747DRAFT_304466 [Aspergillus niger ATCC 13496]|uniref:Uncharacterized protein n=1 Tax=Aspergillus niger ATCC 13496 TaxID=1353008 RepID=A0A370C3U6_ASPNG|nr:hypothetical protein M747DRAFT_304466 [Aspergillus niger ATCC 13496]
MPCAPYSKCYFLRIGQGWCDWKKYSQKFQPISVYGAGHDYALLFVLAAFRIRIVSKAFKPMSNKLKQPLDRTCRSPDLSFMQELLLLVPQAPEILLRASKAGAHA